MQYEQIISRTHILAACFRAVNDYLNGRLKSRNVHSEIVFALGPSNNVRFLHLVLASLLASRCFENPAASRFSPALEAS